MTQVNVNISMSLDGFVADAEGNFDWGTPDEEVHSFVNEWERPLGTYLYGRRMYDVMATWDSPSFVEGQPGYIREYAALWRAAEKVVFSRTLQTVDTRRTRIEWRPRWATCRWRSSRRAPC